MKAKRTKKISEFRACGSGATRSGIVRTTNDPKEEDEQQKKSTTASTTAATTEVEVETTSRRGKQKEEDAKTDILEVAAEERSYAYVGFILCAAAFSGYLLW